MLREAYISGADYYYRLNDDTELLVDSESLSLETKGKEEGGRRILDPNVKQWAKAYIEGLLSMGAPYGVIGPASTVGLKRILTHDFVHRMHMDITGGIYYDPLFTDWWMDDYISFLYGSRTKMSSQFAVEHHVDHHGTKRYTVGIDKSKLVPGRVAETRRAIANFMVDKLGMTKAKGDELINDRQGPPYGDV